MTDATSIEERARAAIARALGAGATAPGMPLAMSATPGWDSMGHMTIVMELEREFGVSFPAYRLPQLTNLDAVVRALRDLSGE